MKYALAFAVAISAAFTLAADPAVAKGSKDCPPGLAKKSPACVPPGQAKKQKRYEDSDRHERSDDRRYHDDDRDRDDDYVYDRYRRGDRLPRDRYVILEEGDRVIFEGREYVVVDTDNGTVLKRGNDWYRLPRHDDSQYVRVGDAVIRVDRETKAVIELIQLVDLILS
jgi:hypothetical protein